MAKKYDLLADVAPMLVSALNWRNDTGVYASGIARGLGIFMEDDEATVLARLREAVAAQASAPAVRVKITVTGDCGHVLWTGFDRIDEKYPFWCGACEDDRRDGKYPWKLATEIVAAEPEPGEACPVYRPGKSGFRWQCMLGMAHNNPDQDPDYDDQQTVHRDQFGTEFRVARCRVPAEHGRSRCWCAVAEHHKPLAEPKPGPCRCGHLERAHNAVLINGARGFCHECEAGTCARYEAAKPDESEPVYLLGCKCQMLGTRAPGEPVTCGLHGDTTVTMTIPLGAPPS